MSSRPPSGLLAGSEDRHGKIACRRVDVCAVTEKPLAERRLSRKESLPDSAPGVDGNASALNDLQELHASGVSVRWPSRHTTLQTMALGSSPAREKVYCADVSNSTVAADVPIDILSELLELQKEGMQVSWPVGYGPSSARQAVAGASKEG